MKGLASSVAFAAILWGTTGPGAAGLPASYTLTVEGSWVCTGLHDWTLDHA